MEVKSHYGWHQIGVEGSKIRVRMCVEGRRETKRTTIKKYTSTSNTGRNILLLLKDECSDRALLTANLRILISDNLTQSCLLSYNLFVSTFCIPV